MRATAHNCMAHIQVSGYSFTGFAPLDRLLNLSGLQFCFIQKQSLISQHSLNQDHVPDIVPTDFHAVCKRIE
jgi:hypothetical protein